MSTSHKNGRTASKVLKVALSAALAAAFTPIAAAPAFAAAPTAAETAAILTTAQNASSANYSGAVISDGSRVYLGYGYGTTGDAFENVKNDAVKFLGLIAAGDNSDPSAIVAPVKKIKYANTVYSWNPNDTKWEATDVNDSLETTIGNALASKLTGTGSNIVTSADVAVGISTDETNYTNITLAVQISTATVKRAGATATESTVYSLAGALQAASSGDTVAMTSNAVYNTQLTLKPGVILEGNYKTLTHLSNKKNTASENAAAIKCSGASEGDAVAVVQNLSVLGPNTTPAIVANNVTTTNNDDGEYAIAVDGSYTALKLKGVTVSRAQGAVHASGSATVTVDGTLNVSGVEFAAVDLTSGGKLALTSKATVTYSDTADTPFVCSKSGAAIENNAHDIKLAKTKKSNSELHYYLSSAPTNGAAYLYQDAELSNTDTEVALGGKTEYAMLKFTPKTTGTYRFASEGSVDVAAELYTMTDKGALGTKISSGDNEQGENFRVFAKLTGGSTYILRVAISAAAEDTVDHGTFTVKATEAVAESLDSYVVTLPANTYYYSDQKFSVKTDAKNKLSFSVKSAIDGKGLDSAKYTASLKKDGVAADDAGAPGRYELVLTAKDGSGLAENSSTKCYFDVLDNENIKDYRFAYNNTLVFASGQVASLTNIAPKGYRYGSSTVTFNEADLAVAGWYSVDANGAEAQLVTAPSAVGNYILKLLPADTVKYSKSPNPVELKFSITKGKVTPPAARTGLTYTGSAQQGVPTGASYTLSGTYSATNAGTYTAYATLAEGYSWSDGTTDPKAITWSIAKAKIAVPTGVANLVYTGKVQTGVAAGTGYTLSGTTTATEPGTYTCTATPSANYAWTDGTSTSKTITWTLGKAPAGITATPSTVVVDEGTKAVVSLKQAGTAAYTVASSNSNVATATVSGSVVTITAKASGSAIITVSTAATSRYAAGTCTIAVSVPKAEGATGSVVDPTTKVTNKFKVTNAADPDDADAVPTVAFTSTSATGKFTIPSSVTLADGVTYKVTSIATKAFEGEAVTQVTVPKSITKIGSYAFRNCKKLTKVTLPSTLKEVGTSAFYGCSKLTSVSVAAGKVGKYAFRNCTKLTSVTLGSKVSSVAADALKGAKATSITLKTSKLSKTSIKNLVKNSKLTTIKCPELSKKVKANYSTWAKTYKWNVKVK